MSENGRRRAALETFLKAWEKNGGEVLEADSDEDAAGAVRRFLQEAGITPVAIAGGIGLGGLSGVLPPNQVAVDFSAEPSWSTAIGKLKNALCGITGVKALIADIGSLVVGIDQTGSHLVSLLPPMHLAVVGSAPVFKDLGEFFSSGQERGDVCFISGPSRTADIEKQLILGVHGPGRVAAVLNREALP